MQSYRDLLYMDSHIAKGRAELCYAEKSALKQRPLIDEEISRHKTELERVHRLQSEETKKYQEGRDKLIKEKGSVDADLKRAKQKQLEYEQMNITEIIRRVEQKSAVTDELTRQQQRRQELTRAYDDVIAKYSALIERVDTDFRAFENAQHALVNEREYATNKQNESLMQTRRNEENEVYTRFEEKSQLSADKLQQLREEKSQQNNELLRIAHEAPYKEEHAKADEELNKLNTRAQELKMSIQQLSTQAVSLRQEAGMKLRELELAQAQPLANAQKEKQEIEEQIARLESLIERRKGSLAEWLDRNKPAWKDTIGKIADEEKILYRNDLAPQVTNQGEASLYGVQIDLTALAKTFPLQEGVSIGGRVGADFRLHCRLSTIQKQDWGRVRLKGKLDMQDMFLRDTKKNFEFTSQAALRFIGDDNLAAQMDIRKVSLRTAAISADLDELNATVRSTNPQDTTRLIDVECKLQMSRLKGEMGDSLKVFSKKAKASLHLQPGKLNPAMPNIKVALETDTLFCRMGDMKMGMDKGGFNLTAEKVRDSVWLPKGIIGFNRLTLRTPELALPVKMRKTAVTVGDRVITLKNASMRIGRSNLTASGSVYGLYAAMKKGKMLKANLEIASRNLDCNQLINALNFPQDTLQAETDTVSSAEPMQLFVIPKNIDFELKTNLKKVTYGNMVFENVQGAVDIRNQAVYLKKLTMRGLEADLETTLVYRARRKTRGYAGFDFRLRKVNIGKLVDFIPSLDTIVPMLRSFKGMVDFDATAEAVLDSNLNVKIPSLKAAMHIKGDSLVLMDGETFAEISKTLMFKNKKRNVFDSISVNLTVQDGNVTVYPFLLQIDRYKAAVGGTQGLDMNFDYHISVLKSPLPFKAGVNITGNLDKMKIRIGKAKYKDAVTPVEIRKVDSTRVNMGQEIIHSFERVMSRTYRGKLPQGAE